MLDIRQVVSEADVASGVANFNFELVGGFSDENTGEISEFKKFQSIILKNLLLSI